jgi:hypothetical protein
MCYSLGSFTTLEEAVAFSRIDQRAELQSPISGNAETMKGNATFECRIGNKY